MSKGEDHEMPPELIDTLSKAFEGMDKKVEVIINEVINKWYPGLSVEEVHFLKHMYWCIYSLVPTQHEEMYYHVVKEMITYEKQGKLCVDLKDGGIIHSKFEMYQVIRILRDKKILYEVDMEDHRTNILLENEELAYKPYLIFWNYYFEEEGLNAMAEVFNRTIDAWIGPKKEVAGFKLVK